MLSALFRIPGHRASWVALILSGLGAATWPVHAQTSYSLSVLKPPGNLSLSPFGRWAIDDQNAVTTTTYWVAGFNLNPFGLAPLGPVLKTFITRWLPSTASSVSAGKLYAQPVSSGVLGVSPDGTKVAMSGSYYDTVTRKETQLVALNGGSVSSFNNSGVGAAELRIDPAPGSSASTYQPGTWRIGDGYQALPQGGFVIGGTWAINARSDVVGWLRDEQGRYSGAMWLDGQLQVVAPLPGQSADVWAINDAGQAVVRRWASACVPSVRATGYLDCNDGLKQYALRQPDGSERPIEPAAGQAIGLVRLTAQGDVLGCMVPPGEPDAQTGYALRPPECSNAKARAFIWSGGTMQDLTAVARAKGAKLPTGAVLTDVLAANARGSFVARMLAADGKTVSFVRLTAK